MIEVNDEAIVLGHRSFGENKRIVSLLTKDHGRVSGIMRQTKASNLRGVDQIGNKVQAIWKGRLDEHLGFLSLDLVESFTGRVLGSSPKLLTLSSATLLAYSVLPERHPYPVVYEAFNQFLASLKGLRWAETYVHFEHKVLEEMGFGLKLEACCVSGTLENLAYVSPKTGRAVSQAAAGPYESKLLKLPAFLLNPALRPENFLDLSHGLQLMAHFFKHAMAEGAYKKLMSVRAQLLKALERGF